MIGSKTFEIGWQNWVKGMSSTNFTEEGGFSPGGTNKTIVNPIASPGLLYPPGPVTDKSTNLVGEMLCSCEDQSGNASRMFLARNSSNEDGTFYYMDSVGGLTLKRTDSSNNYTAGKSDMISFLSEIYATSQGAITRWTPDSLFNTSFFSFNSASAPHPAIVFNNNAYYGDGNLLLRQTTAAGVPSTILTLATGQVIVALGIDPGTGSLLISIVSQLNGSGTVNSQSFVAYYDGFSPQPSKLIPVDDMITAFYNVGSTMFITYGQKLGYWNGAGIQFLRKLDIGFDNTQLAYKQHLTNIGQTLYVIEKTVILAYGEIIGGQGNAFYYPLKNNEGDSGNYSLVTNIGQNRLGLGFATAKFYTFDTLGVATILNGGGIWYSNRYEFPRPVVFNQVQVDFGADATAIDLASALFLITDSGETSGQNLGTPTQYGPGSRSFIYTWPSIESRSLQLRMVFTSQSGSTVNPIRRMVVFLNPSD